MSHSKTIFWTTAPILFVAVFALIIQLITGDPSVWGYLIPIGVVFGILAGNRAHQTDSAEES